MFNSILLADVVSGISELSSIHYYKDVIVDITTSFRFEIKDGHSVCIFGYKGSDGKHYPFELSLYKGSAGGFSLLKSGVYEPKKDEEKIAIDALDKILFFLRHGIPSSMYCKFIRSAFDRMVLVMNSLRKRDRGGEYSAFINDSEGKWKNGKVKIVTSTSGDISITFRNGIRTLVISNCGRWNGRFSITAFVESGLKEFAFEVLSLLDDSNCPEGFIGRSGLFDMTGYKVSETKQEKDKSKLLEETLRKFGMEVDSDADPRGNPEDDPKEKEKENEPTTQQPKTRNEPPGEPPRSLMEICSDTL